ncbi:unnamed protein product [Schistosoma margrebowiei]|uniref:Uncharacterized protein n=1 Tax=Schistosoma margrebowiei TaxID=48269 RepID=A0A3P8A672_9TREM|nr:unnamed protein product [Schistosoma margrebowiei]
MGLVSWMYLHLRVDVHSGIRTQYRSLHTPWLAVESRIHVSFYLGIVSWMYLHLIVDVHSEIRIQYRSLQTPSCYPLSYSVLIAICLCDGVKFEFTWCCFTCIFPLLFRTAIDQSLFGLCAHCAYCLDIALSHKLFKHRFHC